MEVTLKKRKARSTPAGLHLWEVEVCHEKPDLLIRISTTTTLLITTAQQQADTAAKKANGFLRRNKRRYPNAKVRSMSHVGLIDA